VPQTIAFGTSPKGSRVRWGLILWSWGLGSNLGRAFSGFTGELGAPLIERLVFGKGLWWFLFNSFGLRLLLNSINQYTCILKSGVLL